MKKFNRHVAAFGKDQGNQGKTVAFTSIFDQHGDFFELRTYKVVQYTTLASRANCFKTMWLRMTKNHVEK